jgi:hypothetical protein
VSARVSAHSGRALEHDLVGQRAVPSGKRRRVRGAWFGSAVQRCLRPRIRSLALHADLRLRSPRLTLQSPTGDPEAAGDLSRRVQGDNSDLMPSGLTSHHRKQARILPISISSAVSSRSSMQRLPVMSECSGCDTAFAPPTLPRKFRPRAYASNDSPPL